jgi:hypothetical protein
MGHGGLRPLDNPKTAPKENCSDFGKLVQDLSQLGQARDLHRKWTYEIYKIHILVYSVINGPPLGC